jgi:hypothetical protein
LTNSPQPLQPGQFSLLGLLSFMFAWSIYFSMIAVLAARFRQPDRLPIWLDIVIFYVAWVVLALLYWSWRLRRTLVIHCFFPLATILLCGLEMIGNMLAGGSGGLRAGTRSACDLIAVLCILSVLIGRPVATLILLHRVLTRQRP